MPRTVEKLISRKELASRLGVSTRTLDRWVVREGFPAPALILGHPRWKVSDVNKYVDRKFREAREGT